MPSFRSFVSPSAGQSSQLQTPEATPLRKRENDSFSSPDAPLLWRHPLQPATGGLHHASYSPSSMGARYGELNFNHMKRRRGRYDNRHGAQFWIPWVMKAILASPVVVLLIWVVAIALRHPTQSSVNNNKYSRGRPSSLQQQQPYILSAAAQGLHLPKHQPPNHHHKLLPVYAPLGSVGAPNDRGAPPQVFPLLANSDPGEGGYMMMRQPFKLTQQGFQQEQPSQMMVQQANNNNNMINQNMMQLPQQQPGQMYQQMQPVMQQAQPQMQMYQQAQPQQQQQQQQDQPNWAQMQMAEPQLSMQRQAQQQMMQQPEPILTRSHGHNQKPAHPNNIRGGKKTKTNKQAMDEPKVYFYDPSQAVYQGQLQVPRVVYDQHGNEIELASLSSANADIYLEPPQMMAAPVYGTPQQDMSKRRQLGSSYSSSISSTTNNNTDPVPQLPPPPLEMSFKTPESWGESTSQDQSIIVCTVAVMALLVGALSARRLRARSFLASCIENESLEDEVAFDNAYTISGADTYNTFGWKGDLEKFDV